MDDMDPDDFVAAYRAMFPPLGQHGSPEPVPVTPRPPYAMFLYAAQEHLIVLPPHQAALAKQAGQTNALDSSRAWLCSWWGLHLTATAQPLASRYAQPIIDALNWDVLLFGMDEAWDDVTLAAAQKVGLTLPEAQETASRRNGVAGMRTLAALTAFPAPL